MTTQQKRSRQERALNIVRRRLEFWLGFEHPDDPVYVDGIEYIPRKQFVKAGEEQANLARKGIT